MAEDNGRVDVAADTVLGKISAKNLSVTHLVRLAVAVALALVLYVLIEHRVESRDGDAKLQLGLMLITTSIQEQIRATRLNTCVLSMPDSRREREFSDPTSFCHRLVDK